MSLSQKLSRTYFDLIYNPVYDFTTARIDRYHKLQDLCVGKLSLTDGNRVLCAGLGTGNEIRYIVRKNPHVSISGVDYSGKALARARKKALRECRSKRSLQNPFGGPITNCCIPRGHNCSEM